MADRSTPDARLMLEWVYGYKGHQCRNNLYYTASGTVVYFVAGVGVVYHALDKRQMFYLGHSDDIISLALHPDKTLVATAQTGKEPFVCVWDSTSLETISILQGGHERGISALSFNVEGNLLASVGLDDHHTLNVWNWRKGNVMSSARGHGDRIFDVQFSPMSGHAPSLVTCGVKHIKFWTLCGNTLSGKKGIFGKKGELQSVLCASYNVAGEVFTGMLSGDIYKWKGHNLQSVIKGAHVGSIYSLHCSAGGYATGSKDGCVGLWDADFKPIAKLDLTTSSVGYKGLVVRSVCWDGDHVLVGSKGSEVWEVSMQDMTHPHLLVGGHAEGELWGLATHPQQRKFATASDDKTIRVWDMEVRAPLVSSPAPHAVRSLAFSPDGQLLAAGMQNGSFSVHNVSDLSVVHQAKKRKEVLHEMKFSPDGNFLAVGSNDNYVDIYQVGSGFKWEGQCSGSSSFITHLDWSEDSKYIQTNSGASERLFYQIPSCARITAMGVIQDICWASWTGILGSEVNGIWPKYAQVNDINAADSSFEHQTIVTGDDFGLVKLFRFPCCIKGAKFKKYVGHSAHVTNVRFTFDQSHVISVGGADNAIFQWRILREGEVTGEKEVGVREEEEVNAGGGESDSEESDSDMSDVASLDSDLEKEQEISYKRSVYREDLQLIKKKLAEQSKQSSSSSLGESVRGITSQPSSLSSAPSAGPGKRNTVPERNLSMEFIHGYRGYDCRQNLYYTKEGHLVYHVAAVGVVFNKTNHSQSFYTCHTDDILCLGPHPSMDRVATGQIGRDPAIHVWDVATMETESVLKGGHSRGVCAVNFSADGKFLASVGLDDNHCIVVWKWRRGEKLATTRGHKDKIFMLCWNPLAQDKLVTVGIKLIKFWVQTGGGFTSKRGVFGKVGKLTSMLCVCYGVTAEVCYSGGADGRVYHWKDSTLCKTVQANKGPLYAISRVDKGYISGGKDGVVCLWDEDFTNRLKTYKLHSSAIEGGGVLHSDLPPIRALVLGQGMILVGTKNSEILEVDRGGPIHLLIQGHLEGEVWGLATHPRKPLAISASDDGTVRVWSLEEHKMLSIHSVGRPARSVAYSHDGGTVAVGLNDGSFKVFDADWNELAFFHHRKEEISDVKFSPNGKYLAVASHDNFVDLYSLSGHKRVGICKGPSSYITHIDWDSRGKLIQVNTGDRETLYFEAPRAKQQFIPQDTIHTLSWNTWTCVLGPSMQGVWPPYTDVTDVNAACVSSDGQMVATGDDLGYVKIFKYPSYGKHAKCRQYVGHSAHVTNVRFSSDDDRLVSVGGADTAVIVWRLQGGSHDAESCSLAVACSTAYMSEDSDTDSEEEGGYDSDVEREKIMDYSTKIYSAPIRDAAAAMSAQDNLKPHLQVAEAGAASSQRAKVSRSGVAVTKVITTAEETKVKDLVLDYVFGYRCFDTRQNVFMTADDSVVYHAAGAGVVYNPLTKSQSFYLEHNDDIVSLSLCRHQKLQHVVATGQIGKSAAIHVWDIHSKQTLSILQGAHSVGVCSLDFSCNAKLLLAVGLDDRHSITVWRWTEGTRVAQVSGDQRRIFIAQFRPDSSSKFVSCGVKHVRFWSLVGTQLMSRKGHLPGAVPGAVGASMQTMLSLAFAPEDVTFTGSMSGDVYVWKSYDLTRVVAHAHSGPVMAMFTCLDDGLILTAGKERCEEGGGVKLWGVDMNLSRTFSLGDYGGVVRALSRTKGNVLVGTQNGQILEIQEKTGDIKVLVDSHSEGELWGLAAHPASCSFITASDDKTVRLWDLKTKSKVCQLKLLKGARSADISSDGRLTVVGQTNGEFVVLSTSDLSIVRQKRDRSKILQVVRFSPDGARLAVGSDDACVDFYSTSDLIRTGYCRGIPSPVTHLDWSHDGMYIQVDTSSYHRLVFNSSSGKQVTDKAELEKIIWASWTSVLGSEVVGIWPKNADKADVNTIHLNHSGKAVVTGDDYGCVKLFNHFPVSEKFASHKKYFGHSAHVTTVRFTYDDSLLLSVGGDDSCIFVWRCCS